MNITHTIPECEKLVKTTVIFNHGKSSFWPWLILSTWVSSGISQNFLCRFEWMIMVFYNVLLMMIHSVTPYVSTFVNKPPRFVTIWDSHWLFMVNFRCVSGFLNDKIWDSADFGRKWSVSDSEMKLWQNFISIWDAHPCRFSMISKSDG